MKRDWNKTLSNFAKNSIGVSGVVESLLGYIRFLSLEGHTVGPGNISY